MNTVTVTMTFDAENITEVELDVSGETPAIGQAHAEELRSIILDGQSAEFDSVSGATVTSDAVRKAAQACIAQAKDMNYANGPVPDTVMSRYIPGKAEDTTGLVDYLLDTYTADTLEELAQMIEIAPAVLRATVDRYNELCDAGFDADFN